MADQVNILEQYGKYFQTLYESNLGSGESSIHPHFIFACHAVFPSLLTSDLLYQIWYNFRTYTLKAKPEQFQSVPFEAVNDFLHSDICRETGSDQYKVDHELRAKMLKFLDFHVDGNRSKHLAFFLEKYGEYNQEGYYQRRIRNMHQETVEVSLNPVQALQKYQQSLKDALEKPGNKTLNLIKLKMKLEQHVKLRDDFQELNELVGYSIKAISGRKQDQFFKLDYLSSNESEGVFVAEELLGGINKLIDKSDQGLAAFPFELLEDPDKIISLDLSNNKINKLPSELGNLSNLEYLNLNNNPGLDIWDVDWTQLENLRELKLNRLDLEKVPRSLFQCPQLEKLELYRNKLKNIPGIKSPNYSIQHLDLSHNQITHLPQWLFQSTGITSLYLENNQLKKLSEQIGNLFNLKVLHLKDNTLSELPESMQNLTTLQPNNQEKDFQNGFTIMGNDFAFELPEDFSGETPTRMIDFILRQQAELFVEVEEKTQKTQKKGDSKEKVVDELGRPVMFFAYANQIDHSRYLRELPIERKGVRDALDTVVRSGVVDIVERSNATLSDIIDVFQDPIYAGRIKVFHFGGHVDSYSLLMDNPQSTDEQSSEGFSQFLANQSSLELVFLSGCATESEATRLNRAGVPAVITTLGNTKDDITQGFAVSFYRGIGSYVSIKEAFQEAEGIMIGKNGADFRNFYIETKTEKFSKFPWSLLSDEQSQGAATWRLSDESIELIEDTGPLTIKEEAYLFCDRFDQVSQFQEILKKQLSNSKRTPFSLVIYGPEEELPGSLARRLILESNDLVRSLLDKNLTHDSVIDLFVDILPEYFTKGVENFRYQVENQFAQKIGLKEFSIWELISRFQKSEIIFLSHTFHGTLNKEDTNIYADYLKRFQRFELGPKDPIVILLNTFHETRGNFRGILNIFTGDPFQRMIDNLGLNSEQILPKLSPVLRKDVQVWQEENLPESRSLAESIFGNNKELPMRDVEPAIRREIETYF